MVSASAWSFNSAKGCAPHKSYPIIIIIINNLHNNEESREGDGGSHDEGEPWEEMQCLWIDGVEEKSSQHCNQTL